VCAISAKPLGSFTNHFRSKETFAREVLDRYFAGTREFVKQALDDTSLTPPAAIEAASGHYQRRIVNGIWLPDRRFQS